MLNSLQTLNFGPDIIQWTEVFYTDIQSIIINNGHMSESLNIQKGIRQGCPLSSFLFIICIQILTNYIKNNKNIKGITVQEKEIKQSLFADDATFFNNGSLETIFLNVQASTSTLKNQKYYAWDL